MLAIKYFPLSIKKQFHGGILVTTGGIIIPVMCFCGQNGISIIKNCEKV